MEPGLKRNLEVFLQGTHINGLMQERYNSSALAMELCLFCINPSACYMLKKDGLMQDCSNSFATALELLNDAAMPSL